MNTQPPSEPLPLSAAYQTLTRIGLSALSARCYQIIYQQDFISVKHIAQILNKPYRSIYRNVDRLQQQGFVKHVYTGRPPHKYTAILLQEALVSYAVWQQFQVQDLLTQQLKRYYEQTLRQLKD